MKKLGLLFAMLFAAGLCFAQDVMGTYQRLHGSLTDRQVQEKLKVNEFLPVYVNEVASFRSYRNKSILAREAKEQIRKHHNYAAYFNATVVYATNAEFQGLDVDYEITDTDLANVINYSNEALRLGGRNASPALYLLRAETRMTYHGLFQPMMMNTVFYGDGLGRWISTHKREVREILADFEKLETLNPAMAYFHAYEIADMYKYTGNAEKAAYWRGIGDREQARAEQAARTQHSVRTQVSRNSAASRRGSQPQLFFGAITFVRNSAASRSNSSARRK